MRTLLTVCFFIAVVSTEAQQNARFTKSDSLRGSINPNRGWWDVQRYDIDVTPDFETKTIKGNVRINVAVVSQVTDTLQLDLQQPMLVDSIVLEYGTINNNRRRSIRFQQEQDVVWVLFNDATDRQNQRFIAENLHALVVYYHGKPKEAKKAPWDGGWIWKRDAKGRPWMSVAVQGLGASAWYPCKDHPADEPDRGASLTIRVDTALTAVANGRLMDRKEISGTGMTAFVWQVQSPINNYNIVPYIGHYINWNDTLMGEKGKLDLDYWVLDYNKDAAQKQFKQVKQTIRALEYWFGPYPFYEDGYKLVESPHLGMEHQSAVAYGNGLKNGYLARDLSSTGEGLKFDFIIVHESGHEWFGNSVTAKDAADLWIQESFTSFSEVLFLDYHFGKASGNKYCVGVRQHIENDEPMVAAYGVNARPGIDIYYKGENMLQTLRHSVDDDEKFRGMLRKMSNTFYHKTVSTSEIESFINSELGSDYSGFFDQYLRTTKIPELHYYFDSSGSFHYKWENVNTQFQLPLHIAKENYSYTISPTGQWMCTRFQDGVVRKKEIEDLERNYYIIVKETKAKR